MDDLIRRQATYLALVEKGQASKRYKLGETWELNGEEIREVLDALPSAQPEPLTEAEVIICKMYLDDFDKYKTCNEYKLLMSLLDGTASAQPKQRWIPVTEESVIQAGYEGREVRFRIHGRLFAIRELAQ